MTSSPTPPPAPAHPPPHPGPIRPRLAFRLGITGARPNKLDPEALPPLAAAAAAVMRLVTETIAALAAEPALRAAYAPGPPLIRLFTPLAEGSDRIAAEAALAAGLRLEVPMPFPVPEYEQTFAADPAPFRTLLAAARTEAGAPAALTLDGTRAEDIEGYRAVGRFVVRNADLLIAIWDGAHGNPGGTGEIVRYAVRSHVPVWWIDPAMARPPRLLLGPMALERPEAAATGPAASTALAFLLRAAIAPPAPGRPHHHTWLGAAVHWLAGKLGHRPAPLNAYLAETEEPVRPARWRVYARALASIAPAAASPTPTPAPIPEPADAVEQPWEAMYEAADRHGQKYADRYRSSYVLIIALAALTVSALGLGLAAPRLLALPAAFIELLALLVILFIVIASESGRWHERWIAYRLLAELCRKQRMLARLGGSLPLAQVTDLAQHPDGTPRDAWVAWYVTASLRGAELPHGPIAPHVARARAIGADMIATQTSYHAQRARRSRTAARRLIGLGEIAFLATLVLVGTKFGFLLVALLHGYLGAAESHATGRWVGFVCTAFAALSAGFVSLRAYAEFDLLHLQSAHMLRVLAETKQELEAIDLSRPLASAALGAVLHSLALAMLQDVQGWSLLFRTKTPETS